MARYGGWLLLALFVVESLAAHDLWIEPSSYAPPPGESVAIGLRIGERFVGDPVPRDGAGIARLAVLGPAGEAALPGVEGVDPAGLLAAPAPGAYWIVYETRPHRITLEANRFEAYLAEEGLGAVSALRAARGQSGAPGREVYQRCAKSLIVVGAAVAGARHPVAGCDLELLLDASAGPAAAGNPVRLRLTLHGSPVAGALVSAVARGRPETVLAERTDARGEVSFPIGRPGAWLFRAVHMEPEEQSAEDAEWRSWWASLTVRLRDR